MKIDKKIDSYREKYHCKFSNHSFLIFNYLDKEDDYDCNSDLVEKQSSPIKSKNLSY